MSSCKTWVVTGGAGMVGSRLVRLLLSRGDRVVVMDDLSRGDLRNIDVTPPEVLRRTYLEHWEEGGVVFRPYDLRLPVPFGETYGHCAGVFHLAARLGGVGLMHERQEVAHGNAAIDYNVAEFCAKTGLKCVYVSTACVYPVDLQNLDGNREPLNECHATILGASPESLYGWIKLCGEQAFLARANAGEFDVSVVRAFNAVGGEFGPVEERHVVPALMSKIMRGDDPVVAWGDGTAERSMLDADDMAEAILCVMEMGEAGGIYNVGTPERRTVQSILFDCMIACAPNRKPPGYSWDASRPVGVGTRGPALARIHSLGWKARTPFEESLRKVREFYERFPEALHG